MQLNATNNPQSEIQSDLPAENVEIESENIEIEILDEDDNDLDENSSELSDEEKDNGRFKDGEMLTMIRVRFPGNAKSFPFLLGKRKFNYGQKVVAMSDRGMTVGYINSFPYQVTFNKSMLPIRSIAKAATDEDIRVQAEFRDSEKKAEVICLNLIERYNLDMVLTHVEFTQFGKKAVFYFNAPARVDFRDLVKDLVAQLKMRIELRQISVRDRAAAIGAIGACGLQTCCSSFLKNYGNVSIKMAKNQNLALMASKLNGVCGQIKCCIKYEDDVYTDKRKLLPKEGTFIQTRNGDRGKVLRLHLLIEQFEMLTDTGLKRAYAAGQYQHKDRDLPSSYRFPDSFDHISDETKTVIGLEEYLAFKKKQSEAGINTVEVDLSEEARSQILKNNDVEDIETVSDQIVDDSHDDEVLELNNGQQKNTKAPGAPQHSRNNNNNNRNHNGPRNNDRSGGNNHNNNRPNQGQGQQQKQFNPNQKNNNQQHSKGPKPVQNQGAGQPRQQHPNNNRPQNQEAAKPGEGEQQNNNRPNQNRNRNRNRNRNQNRPPRPNNGENGGNQNKPDSNSDKT